MEIYCKVTSAGLVPMYDSDLEQRKRLKEGETVLCTIKKPRNYEFHKKFFALLRLTYDNLPERLVRMLSIRNEDDLLICLKLELGWIETVWHGRKHFVIPKSISFASMDETEFQAFYDRCIDIILSVFLRGTTKQELLDEIERFK